MPCLNLSLPPPPQIPPIFIGALGPYHLTFGQFGINCCSVQLPNFSIPQLFPGSAILAAIMKAINTAMIAAWPALSLQIPNCPFNGKQL